MTADRRTALLEKAKHFIAENRLNIYDIAVMTEDGAEAAYCQPCNACNESYSVTKLFINTMIGILADSRQLDPEDKLTGILRNQLSFSYDKNWDEVTIRHALQHRMGIDKGVTDIDCHNVKEYGTDDYLRYIFAYPPKYPAGEYRMYTDVPHYLLARIIREITGREADEVILEQILRPLQFQPSAWKRCPQNHTIGATGAVMCAEDMVKIAWLYMNHGVYGERRIISRDWVELSEREEFDLYPQTGTDFIGKAGMRGQMTMYNRKERFAAAWHGYEAEGRNQLLISFFQKEMSGDIPE